MRRWWWWWCTDKKDIKTHTLCYYYYDSTLSLSRRIVTVFALQKGPDIIITQGLWWGQILWWVIKPQTGWKLKGWIIIINKYTGVCVYFFFGGDRSRDRWIPCDIYVQFPFEFFWLYFCFYKRYFIKNGLIYEGVW